MEEEGGVEVEMEGGRGTKEDDDDDDDEEEEEDG